MRMLRVVSRAVVAVVLTSARTCKRKQRKEGSAVDTHAHAHNTLTARVLCVLWRLWRWGKWCEEVRAWYSFIVSCRSL